MAATLPGVVAAKAGIVAAIAYMVERKVHSHHSNHSHHIQHSQHSLHIQHIQHAQEYSEAFSDLVITRRNRSEKKTIWMHTSK